MKSCSFELEASHIYSPLKLCWWWCSSNGAVKIIDTGSAANCQMWKNMHRNSSIRDEWASVWALNNILYVWHFLSFYIHKHRQNCNKWKRRDSAREREWERCILRFVCWLEFLRPKKQATHLHKTLKLNFISYIK